VDLGAGVRRKKTLARCLEYDLIRHAGAPQGLPNRWSFRKNAAMRIAPESLLLALTLGAPTAGALDAYDETLQLQGVTFRVHCDNGASLNTLTLTPSGLEIDNTPVSAEVDGVVTGAEVADLNADGSPEVYVYVTSAGSGSYGSLAAWSANKKKSLSMIHLPDLAEDPVHGRGYMGHDELAVAGHYLVRSFPVYEEGNTNAAPTGGIRQLQYRLEPGEAAWQLVIDRSVKLE